MTTTETTQPATPAEALHFVLEALGEDLARLAYAVRDQHRLCPRCHGKLLPAVACKMLPALAHERHHGSEPACEQLEDDFIDALTYLARKELEGKSMVGKLVGTQRRCRREAWCWHSGGCRRQLDLSAGTAFPIDPYVGGSAGGSRHLTLLSSARPLSLRRL